MYEKSIEPVAIMHTGFGEKFGIPRQSGLVPEATGQRITAAAEGPGEGRRLIRN